MTKGNILALASVVFAVATGLWAFIPESPIAAKEGVYTPKKRVVADKSAPEKNTSSAKNVKKEPVKTEAVQKPVYNVKETVYLDDVYEPVSVAEMKTKIEAKAKVEPIGAYTMPEGTIRKLYYGDTILLPDVAGHDYELKIEKRTIGKSGSVILEASVGGDDSIVRSVLTEGERTSYITLNTAEGVYEFESIDGNGFVYSSADIKNQMIDYSKTDGIHPPSSSEHTH